MTYEHPPTAGGIDESKATVRDVIDAFLHYHMVTPGPELERLEAWIRHVTTQLNRSDERKCRKWFDWMRHQQDRCREAETVEVMEDLRIGEFVMMARRDEYDAMKTLAAEGKTA